MEPVPVWVWIAGGVALVAAVFGVARHLERRRTQALEQAALRLGMTFQARDDNLEAHEFNQLPLFQRGHSRRIKNVASAGNQRFFGYSYTVGSGQNSSTHVQTVAVFDSASRGLPRFELKPEGLFDRLGSALGGQDIDFEEDPGFSRAYRLKGPDEEAIRQTFHAGLRQHLVSEGGWSVEGEGPWLVLYRRSKRIRPDGLADFIESARRISALFP